MRKLKGFTLIELLIVVAIIAILAAIAVPNFLEAQTRSKVSRVRSDMRTVATALEAYMIDNNRYPTDGLPRPAPGDNTVAGLTLGHELSTPIAYISSMAITVDPFRMERADIRNATSLRGRERYGYTNWHGRQVTQPTTDFTDVIARFGQWRLYSAGPDRYFFYTGQPTQADYQDWTIVNYDPTNGTISYGDIFRTQRDSEKAIPVQ